MRLRVIFAATWVLPMAFLGGILYSDMGAAPEKPRETNTAMRSRMCREHISLAQQEPSNGLVKTAIEECVVAGYISREDANTAID